LPELPLPSEVNLSIRSTGLLELVE
jgi:hypothetical protein